MSVICQNFVQNAWKKDLCSNCFKSVGDHENPEVPEDDAAPLADQNESLNGRYVSQASSVYPRSNANPHTTWKSLINEKNGKNSQPFNLEKGFQGRLLTINKASNGTDKKITLECNGHGNNHSESQRTTVKDKCLTKAKVADRENAPQTIKTNSVLKNGFKVDSIFEIQNGVKNNKCSDDQNHESETKYATKNSQNNHQNEEVKERPISEKTPEKKIVRTQTKFSKSNSLDAQPSTKNGVLQGILKKTVSSSETNGQQSRRGSNVGFKDEEPLIIGYGGRDFSPEELEWEMASSDGEFETASDSMDETEDDKVFSKMTKQNTEFNSDNSNLLQKNGCVNIQNGDGVHKAKNADRKLGGKILRRSANVSQMSKIERGSHETRATIPVKSKNGEETKDKSSPENIGGDKLECGYAKTRNGVEECGASDPKNTDTPISNGNHLAEAKVNQTAHSKMNGGVSDSINVAIRSDKTNQAATSAAEVTLVKMSVSEVETKNNSAFLNGALPNPQNSPADGGRKTGMFSDAADEGTWQGRSSPDLRAGGSEWPEGALPGQILQAINTSLTNRQQMKEGEKTGKESSEEMNSIDETSDQNGTILPTLNDDCDEVTTTENGPLNVEPRASFLHGIASSNNGALKPSAIYGPASDLFVSRSSSSSSSSSEELRKSQISINVIVNGEKNMENESEKEDFKEEKLVKAKQGKKSDKVEYTHYKSKPKIPAKPSKQTSESNLRQNENLPNNRCDYDNFNYVNKSKSENDNGEIYSSVIEEPQAATLIDHYAESNIYHEVNIDSKIQEHELAAKSQPARESKLAALAMELEQVRHCNGNMKRQAPLPPKIPDPPLEDPPSCADSPSLTSHTFSSFKGETATFSSASSTTSNSSQDTETGYASWNLSGYALTDDQPPKCPKSSKSSFLLTQYSKCKQMAINYAEDGARARKKFSIKKLLKIGKESETPATFDPNCPNPKAWKYNDHFEKPRAKLEIIHPMDLEIKTVTVNPGFDSANTGSVTSFTSSTDDLSFRNSISSDYGSYYSDTLIPSQESKQEVDYEYIQPRILQEDGSQHVKEESNYSTTSPTPSRSSVGSSQASSTCSNSSSKNGATQHRPPKPPPPPRAHSLLPGNKASRNSDGTYKFPIATVESPDSDDVITPLPSKPQAPRRQCKTSAKLECSFEGQKIAPGSHLAKTTCISTESISISSTEISHCDVSSSGSYNTATFSVQMSSVEAHDADLMNKESSDENMELENNIRPIQEEVLNSSETLMETKELQTLLVVNKSLESSSYISNSELLPSTSITISSTKPNNTEEKLFESAPSQAIRPPISKAPTRPPPIYSKPISVNFVKNPKPWKTLEDSYLVLSSSNRELLIKLVNQALKRRKEFLSVFRRMQFQWSDFEIDASQPSSVFAFGEKIAYHATMPNQKKHSVTLVITIQQQNRFQDGLEIKYPVLGQFTDFIPSDLLENSCEGELESMQARVLVLSHSNITTIECFTENLPESLTEENERELCFIILQLIQSLKSLQAQGIESMDTSFQNLILAKTTLDRYYTLVFLSDSCFDENDYSSDSNRISLCEYALSLLFQMLKIQSAEDFQSISSLKFSSAMTRRVYQAIISVLSEEKAISLSQTKVLLECFLWGITKVVESSDEVDDIEAMFHRWIDIERSSYIKNMINDELRDINIQNEYFSQFLIRTSVRNIREVLSIL